MGTPRGPTRRSVLRGALAVGVGGAALAGCSRGGAEPASEGSFTSAAMGGATVGWLVVRPPDAPDDAHLPVVIALHGKGGNHRDVLGLLRPDLLSGTQTEPAFAVASVDGGGGYFHRRSDGTDAGALVSDELVPLLHGAGLDTQRLGLWGWSMGGYGALLLAATRLHGPVRAVATMSAALWTTPGATAPGAFDSADDYRRHDVFAQRTALGALPLQMVCGRSDPFLAANRAYVTGFTPPPATAFEAGGHDEAYWSAQAPTQLRFLAAHL